MIRNRIKIALLLVAILCISVGLSWYFLYLPFKEMSELEMLKERLLVNRMSQIHPMPPGNAVKLDLILRTGASVSAIKKDIITNSVGLQTEKAKKASAALLLTAECMDRICDTAWFVESEFLKSGAKGIATKEFSKNSSDFFKNQKKLDEELLPLLKGHFPK